MKGNSIHRRYDPSYLTREITLHNHKYRQRGGNPTIDSKTHPSRQWTLQPIIIDVRHEAEFRQQTSYLTSEVTTHPHRYPSRGRIRAIDSGHYDSSTIGNKALYFILRSILNFYLHTTLKVSVFPSKSSFDTYSVGVCVFFLVEKHTL